MSLPHRVLLAALPVQNHDEHHQLVDHRHSQDHSYHYNGRDHLHFLQVRRHQDGYLLIHIIRILQEHCRYHRINYHQNHIKWPRLLYSRKTRLLFVGLVIDPTQEKYPQPDQEYEQVHRVEHREKCAESECKYVTGFILSTVTA